MCSFGIIFCIQPHDPPPAGGFSKFNIVADIYIFLMSNIGGTENMNFDKVSGDASWRPDYPNQPKNNQKGTGFESWYLR